MHPVADQRSIFQWIGFVSGQLQVPHIEGILVDNQQATPLELPKLRDKRRGIHGNKHIGSIPRCMYIFRREV